MRAVPIGFPCVGLLVAAVSTTAGWSGVRVAGETYRKHELAILEIQRKEATQAAIVSYDRSRATCLDKVDHPPERVRVVGGSYCAKLALLPGTQTVETKIVQRDELTAGNRVESWSYSPNFEGRPVTFDYEAGRVYQLHASVTGRVSVRCRTGRGGPFKWRRCGD